MSEPPQLASLYVEEEKLLPGDQTPHPMSKGAPSHPYYSLLNLGTYSIMTGSQ